MSLREAAARGAARLHVILTRDPITKVGEGMADQGGLSETAGYAGAPQPSAPRRRSDIAQAFQVTRDVKTLNPTPGPTPELLET